MGIFELVLESIRAAEALAAIYQHKASGGELNDDQKATINAALAAAQARAKSIAESRLNSPNQP